MIEWLADYGLFLAKTATLVIALGVILMLIAHGRRKGQGSAGSTLKVVELDERFQPNWPTSKRRNAKPSVSGCSISRAI